MKNPMFERYVFAVRCVEPAMVLPRSEQGIDWDAERVLLARKTVKRGVVAELFWRRAGKTWGGGMRSSVYMAGALILRVADVSGRLELGTHLHDGGRLSKGLLAAHTVKLEEVFGPEAVAFLDPNRTVIVEG